MSNLNLFNNDMTKILTSHSASQKLSHITPSFTKFSLERKFKSGFNLFVTVVSKSIDIV